MPRRKLSILALCLSSVAFPSAFVGAASVTCGPGDVGKKGATSKIPFRFPNGREAQVEVLCGEDSAQASARLALHKRYRLVNGQKALALAKLLEEQIAAAGYEPPSHLDAGTSVERPRVLKTGGLYSRRAAEHGRREEYSEAIADLLRGLMRPNVDETAMDKLMATMVDYLKKADDKRKKSSEEGDLLDLFEAFEMDDASMLHQDIDRLVLKRRYRELSVRYHPDKNPEAAHIFNELRDAYEILSDPIKTMLYDTGGQELVRKYEGESNDLDKTPSRELRLEVDLKDVYQGSVRKISNARRVVCRSCRLHPNLPRCQRCQRCPGERRQRQRWLNNYQYTVEEYEVPSPEKCESVQDRDVAINIERGMASGERVVHQGMANQLPKHVPGDLIVQLKVKPHSTFQRIDNDLAVVVRISLYEALLGFERELVHLDGHIVSFSVPRGTVVRPGSGLEIENEGMPLREDPTTFGRLFVKFEIDFPKEIDESKGSTLEEALLALGLGPQPLRSGVVGQQGQKSKGRNEL
mmetsp:Transcript_87481/g.192151  ORF Transcript_87481/g.192151 Transcript_87481/m.192151 type:complete len:523 (+) Transcript_87481:314-1882(+)